MLSNEDMTTVPPSELNNVRFPRPLSTRVKFSSGMWVKAGPHPRQPMAPVVQCDSSFSWRPVGGRALSPLTAGQRPDAQLYGPCTCRQGCVQPAGLTVHIKVHRASENRSLFRTSILSCVPPLTSLLPLGRPVRRCTPDFHPSPGELGQRIRLESSDATTDRTKSA